jgi:hypothetical protein
MDALAKRLKRISAAKNAVCAGAKGFYDRVLFQDVKQHNDLYIGMKFANLTKQTADGELLMCHSTDEGYLKPSFDEGLEQIVGCDRCDRLEALAALQCVGQQAATHGNCIGYHDSNSGLEIFD